MTNENFAEAIRDLADKMSAEKAYGSDVMKKYCVECNCSFDGNRFHYVLLRRWKNDGTRWNREDDIIWEGDSDKTPESFAKEIWVFFFL